MRPPQEAPSRPERLEQRIAIAPDGQVVARSGKVEIGQGIRTGFARIVAEELHVPVSGVTMVLGETDSVPWDRGTFGSMSTAVDGQVLRRVAVRARQLLLDRASLRLNLPVSALTLADGWVRGQDGRAASYVELTRNEPLVGPVPETLEAAAQSPQPAADTPQRLEALAIVTGAARYPADVRLPGMLHGHVLRPPHRDARLLSLDDSAARALPGIVAVVRDGDFVGVIAEHEAQPFAALAALAAQWTDGEATGIAPVTAVLRQDAGVDAAFATSARRVVAAYSAPHIAHASILPRAAVADMRGDGADLYVATQRPFGLRDTVAEMTGLSPDRVHVHPQMMSGLYGRGGAEDVSIEAARLSRAVGRPVLVQWGRGEEFRQSPHRPRFEARIEAGLGASGGIAAWRYTAHTNPFLHGTQGASAAAHGATAGRDAEPAYRLGDAEIAIHVAPAEVPTMAFRSLGAALNVFAIECFMDELAHAAGQDPVDFRLRHVDDARLRRVLDAVRERSAWGRPRAAGSGIGIACAIYHGTYIAEVAEVSVGAGRAVRLERVWCAVDAGRLVHPDGARNQIEGGVQQAASWSLLEDLKVKDGAVVSTSWRDYPIATFLDAPASIEVDFVGDPTTPSTGVGEPGSVPTAAAIANAIFDACGIRVRDMPLARTLASA